MRVRQCREPRAVEKPVALLAVATGFAQFAPTASLSDVATAFGADGGDAAAVGLSATTVGIGLAIIRFASLGALPLSSVADRYGRRRVLIGTMAIGLSLTGLAAARPRFIEPLSKDPRDHDVSVAQSCRS